MSAAADRLWVHLPLRTVRVSRTLGAVLVDGAYLRGTPVLWWAAPAGAFAVGVLFALLRDPTTTAFTASIGALVLFAALSGWSAAVGLWLTLGYALADQVSPAHRNAFRFASATDALAIRASWVLSALVLALLVVLVPLTVTVVRAAVGHQLRSQPLLALVASASAAAATAALVAFGWIQVSPVLIRPVFTWPDGTSPTVEAVATMQTQGWMIVAAVVVMAIARTFGEHWMAGRLTPLAVTRPVLPEPTAARSALTAVGSAALLTFLFSGVYTGFAYAAVAFVGFTVCGLLRRVALPRAGGYADMVGKVPVVLRLVVLVGTSVLAGRVFLSLAQGRRDETFTFVLWTLLATCLAAAVLLPGTRPAATAAARRSTSTAPAVTP